MGSGEFDHYDRQCERGEQENPTPPEFEPFEKIARLKRDIIITEKIDGSNAQIYIDEHDNIFAGSRKRWIKPGKGNDNFGFAGWVYENREELLKLGPGRHYGEWWGAGIQRRYGLDHKRFSLFNSGRWDSEFNRQWVGQLAPTPECCSVVPILYRGPFEQSKIDEALRDLATVGSYAAPGFSDPEGIIVYHAAIRKNFKVTLKNDEMSKGEAEALAKKEANETNKTP